MSEGGEIAEGSEAAKEAKHWEEVERHFTGFWGTYPRKEGEAEARAAFRKLFPPGEDKEFYLERLRKIENRIEPFLDNAEELVRCGDRKFIPKPENWLKREFGDV